MADTSDKNRNDQYHRQTATKQADEALEALCRLDKLDKDQAIRDLAGALERIVGTPGNRDHGEVVREALTRHAAIIKEVKGTP